MSLRLMLNWAIVLTILMAISFTTFPGPAAAYGGASGFVPVIFPILCKPFTVPVIGITIQLCEANAHGINRSIQDRLQNFWQAVREKPGLNFDTA